jgi:hypothetical protein
MLSTHLRLGYEGQSMYENGKFPVYAVKAYWGSVSTAPLVPNLCARWKWVFNIRYRSCNPREKDLRYVLNRSLSGSQGLRTFWRRENCPAPAGIQTPNRLFRSPLAVPNAWSKNKSVQISDVRRHGCSENVCWAFPCESMLPFAAVPGFEVWMEPVSGLADSITGAVGGNYVLSKWSQRLIILFVSGTCAGVERQKKLHRPFLCLIIINYCNYYIN